MQKFISWIDDNFRVIAYSLASLCLLLAVLVAFSVIPKPTRSGGRDESTVLFESDSGSFIEHSPTAREIKAVEELTPRIIALCNRKWSEKYSNSWGGDILSLDNNTKPDVRVLEIRGGPRTVRVFIGGEYRSTSLAAASEIDVFVVFRSSGERLLSFSSSPPVISVVSRGKNGFFPATRDFDLSDTEIHYILYGE